MKALRRFPLVGLLALLVVIALSPQLAFACDDPHHNSVSQRSKNTQRDANTNQGLKHWREYGAKNGCPDGEICCPVCGMTVQAEAGTPHVVFSKGQKVYFCSDEHATEFAADPMKLEDTSHRQHSPSEAEGLLCPVCGMQAESTSVVDFAGNQSVFFCAMEGKLENFKAHAADYISERPGSEPKYCAGRTVMYMSQGFTFQDSTCLVLWFNWFVIDSTAKMVLAHVLCLALAFAHGGLVHVRRILKVTAINKSVGRTSSSDTGTEHQSLLARNQQRPDKKTERWLSVLEALLYAFAVAVGYLLMLAAMTYHAGLLLAVLAGFAMGHYVFRERGSLAAAAALVPDDDEPMADPCCGSD